MRSEANEPVEDGQAVVVGGAGDVLGGDVQPFGDGPEIGVHIGLVGQLHERIGVLAREGEDAARAVILEGARQDPAIRAGHGRGDGVPGKALHRRAVEAEPDRAGPVDAGAPGQAEAFGHRQAGFRLGR
jgi:hypothetical protein